METNLSDAQMQQAWWDSMTDEQREAYEDAAERDRAEREVYGRTLTEAERAAIENPCAVCGAEWGTGDCDDCADKRAADARSAAGWA